MSALEEAGGELALAVETFLGRYSTEISTALRIALHTYWRVADGEQSDCDTCHGSGEGVADRTVCGKCRGKGVT